MPIRAKEASADQGRVARIGLSHIEPPAAPRRDAIRSRRRVRALSCLIAGTLIAAFAAEGVATARAKAAAKPAAAAPHKPAAAAKAASKAPSRAAGKSTGKNASKSTSKSATKVAGKAGSKDTSKAAGKDSRKAKRSRTAKARGAKHAATAKPETPPAPPLPGDLGLARQAIQLVGKRQLTDAATVVKTIEDPVIRKLVEWTQLRNGDSTAGFERYAAFIDANPHWPGAGLFRRRAETRLWQERRSPVIVHAFIPGEPASIKGRLALARARMSEGDRAGAERDVRAVWRLEALSDELESMVLETFPGSLDRSDHLARMDRRIGAKEMGAAMRAARRVGDDAVAIVKACSAALANSDEAGKLLDAVPADSRRDLGYALCRAHHLVRKNDLAGAARVMAAADQDAMAQQDTDEWWRERRTLARKLLDAGEPSTAYQVVCGAASPANPYYRAEFHFMAGWIALRFLRDPATALAHFALVDRDTANPIVLARAAYWRGRAHEAAGHGPESRAAYEAAARHTTAYYGQLARARLGRGEIDHVRPSPPPAEPSDAEVVHAAEVLYAIGERDLALSFVTDFAEQSDDTAVLAALGALAARNGDARATLLIGKAALARGFALDVYAFPDIGIPRYAPIGPALDRSIVFSIARTESEFNQRDVSPAKAVGLMQVTPEAGRDTAKRFKVKYDWKQLVSDPVYNTQMGAAELAALLQEYRGSYIMSFAGYNAGRGRVRDWVARYGDPRDPKVDPIDWVERIPFSETRNYVQRVMENLQVYRVRFGAAAAKLEPPVPAIAADDPRLGPAALAEPALSR